MFASLKSKIKEETGSDITKLTSSWRSGTLFSRITNRDDMTISPSSSGGQGDSTVDSVSPQMEQYMRESTGGDVELDYATILEERLKERDQYWQEQLNQIKLSLGSVQGEEAAAAQAVARLAQVEAVQATEARLIAEKQLRDLKDQLAASLHAQKRLDELTEELENARRDWARERTELKTSLSDAELRLRNFGDELALIRASLPPGHEYHQFDEQVSKSDSSPSKEGYERLKREHAVLTRQLQEAKLALADVKTSWSGQIASLETQDRVRELEDKLSEVLEENEELRKVVEDERTLVLILQSKLDECTSQSSERQVELQNLNILVNELQHDCVAIEKKYEKERREKDDALLRNAHMSQSIQLNQCDIRDQENEITDMKNKIKELESVIAQHKENQATCMLIKESELTRLDEIKRLNEQIMQLTDSETSNKKTISELETELSDKNKKIKTLEGRIGDMKKTLQREVASRGSEAVCAEEADISRRYLKHVVLRFLTARELEARQLTRALSVLLRLSAHEEAALRAALPGRSGMTAWLPGLSPT